MSEDTPSSDKQYEPTQKKLDDERKKGELARSADLNTAATYAGFLIVAWAAGAWSLIEMGSRLSMLLAQPASFADDIFTGRSSPFIGALLSNIGPTLVPWAILPAAVVILSVIAQGAFVFAPTKLAPQLSRISPIKGFGNKFGRNGFFEFFKSFLKLLIYSTILGAFLVLLADEILGTIYLEPPLVTVEMLRLTVLLVSIVLGVAIALGAIDFLWQKAEHSRKNRMSRKEMTDEQKEAEGDPQMKQVRRQRAITFAMNQMLAEVPKADVVIVNPTHYAVALKWDRLSRRAPVCIAKGTDEIAAKIREIATEHRIAIHSDPPTARALHAALKIGDEIRPDHYRAVAAAIRFAESLRRKPAAT